MSSLSDKEKQNAINEVRLIASIHSPSVVCYKEAFVTENSLCIVMEYTDNGDLFEKICHHQKKNTLFKEEEIWSIFIQMCGGLKAMHDLKIFHRDIKSANIFLNKDGTTKLGDMNVSKVAKKGMLYTQTGTPYYASPEVWRDQPYDCKSDIWSAGCVLYEMCGLKPPFRAEDMQGLYKKVLRGQYPKIPSVYSSDMSQLIKALLQVSPHMRPDANKILSLPIIQKRINDKILPLTELENSELLNTIKVPQNLCLLTDRLPKATYADFSQIKSLNNNRLHSRDHSHSVKETKDTDSHLPDISRRDEREDRDDSSERSHSLHPHGSHPHQQHQQQQHQVLKRIVSNSSLPKNVEKVIERPSRGYEKDKYGHIVIQERQVDRVHVNNSNNSNVNSHDKDYVPVRSYNEEHDKDSKHEERVRVKKHSDNKYSDYMKRNDEPMLSGHSLVKSKRDEESQGVRLPKLNKKPSSYLPELNIKKVLSPHERDEKQNRYNHLKQVYNPSSYNIYKIQNPGVEKYNSPGRYGGSGGGNYYSKIKNVYLNSNSSNSYGLKEKKY